MPTERDILILQIKGFDAAHYRRTEQYTRQVDRLCQQAAGEYASLAGTLFQPDPNKPFSFDDYPKTRAAAARLTSNLAGGMKTVITQATDTEWRAACDKNDAFINSILKTSRLTPDEAQQYQARNLEALQAFQKRKIEGMDLSQRVWKCTSDIKETIELGIDVGLGEGRSAQELSRDLRGYLNEPNALFRRVRDKYGNLNLSKAAKLYHPGRGVYRSSAKNAMRLARTEVNMAYRESEYLRWQQLDFVVGIRIWLSNNHTILDSKGNPIPLIDVCDDLAGNYPKTFRFVGWHPQCRCVVTPILSDLDEFNKERAGRFKEIVRKIKYEAMPSRRTVNAMPENFTRHIQAIAERSKGWKSQPYYIRHNFQGGTIAGGLRLGVAGSLKGAVEDSRSKAPIKNNSKTITEFDNIISRLKRWAYAFGLDVSKLNALRLGGDREPLRAEVERLDALSDERQDQWLEAVEDTYEVVKKMKAQGFDDLHDNFLKRANQFNPTETNYYASCIRSLQTLKVEAEAALAKAIAAEAINPSKLKEVNKEIKKAAEANKVQHFPAKEFDKPITEKQMIERLGGRDKTKGSCSSLAFAYAANKGGLDVLDFRGGSSCEMFSRRGNIKKIVDAAGGQIERGKNDFTQANTLLKSVEKDKEYYFVCGRHAAIVRKNDDGYQYLELQGVNDDKSPIYNGWHRLDQTVLKYRFKAQKRHTAYGMALETENCMIEISKLYKDSGYKKMIGYINTQRDKQIKGIGGGLK